MPKLTIKNTSATLLSLTIGQVGPGAKRSFDLSRTRLDSIHPELTRLLDRGRIEFWTDATLRPNFDEGSEALRGKLAEIDELQQRAAEIEGLRREWARSLHLIHQELREVRDLKNEWVDKFQSLKHQFQLMAISLQKVKEVEILLGKANRVESLLSRSEEVDLLRDKVQYIDSVLAQADDVTALQRKAKEVQALHERLSERVATPLSDVVRVEGDRLISWSQKETNTIPDMSLILPSSGSWLISFEAVMHSPVVSHGFIGLDLGGVLTERPTGHLRPEGTNSPIFMTELCEVPAGAVVEAKWRSSKGAMRMTTRRLTAMKVSQVSRVP